MVTCTFYIISGAFFTGCSVLKLQAKSLQSLAHSRSSRMSKGHNHSPLSPLGSAHLGINNNYCVQVSSAAIRYKSIYCCKQYLISSID
ncbi:hypothetical protein XENTR_v10018127 [Xenopus tropicalis]|nr:hypothetical protein XENTR_v10018127 [Xenopus tropicalis]